MSAKSSARAAFIRGRGKGFSADGDLHLAERMADDFDVCTCAWREARGLVYNTVNCDKPIVSVIHGPAVEARLVAGSLADISIATKDARIVDGHTRLGVAAGGHVTVVWPLSCDMAKTRYYPLLCESMTGEEAGCVGLISLAVSESKLVNRAFEVTECLAAGSQTAIRWTKHALNNQPRLTGSSSDTSLALKFMGSAGPDMCEGIASLYQERPPTFDGA